MFIVSRVGKKAVIGIGVWVLAVTPAVAQGIDARIIIDADQPGPRINPDVYGQFVEHLGRGVYEGIWVGEDSAIPNVRGIRSDVVAALRRIRVPVVRWPGGCFAERYHWRDGLGPRDRRPLGVNAARGNEPETNAFGSHEFMDFLEQIGAKAFLSVNVASGSPGEAQAWLRYLTGPATSGPGQERARNGHPQPYEIAFVGIGNETWGCGGNMTAEYYSDVYRRYVSVLGRYGTLVAADANSDDYAWTETLLKRALYRHAVATPLAYISRRPQISMMGLHFYTFAGNDWGKKSRATGFSETDWALSLERTSKMDELITRHAAILDRYDPEGRIGLSINEWGSWWAADESRPSNLYQVATLRDAVIAGLTLNIFQNHAERVRMANIAQMINVLQAMILTRGEKMIVTPTYHVFDLYQPHQGATRVPAHVSAPDYSHGDVELPSLSASASRHDLGTLTLSLVNLDPNRDVRVRADVHGFAAHEAAGRVVTAATMDAHPDFDAQDPLVPVALGGVVVQDGAVTFTAPAKSVLVIELGE